MTVTINKKVMMRKITKRDQDFINKIKRKRKLLKWMITRKCNLEKVKTKIL